MAGMVDIFLSFSKFLNKNIEMRTRINSLVELGKSRKNRMTE